MGQARELDGIEPPGEGELDLVADPSPDDFEPVVAGAYGWPGFGAAMERLPFHPYVARHEGRPAACLGIFDHERDAGVELVGTIPDTLWQPTNAGVHHLGYWSDEVDRDVATLVANGVQLEARSLLPDGSSLWAYCRAASGPRIEFVSRVLEPVMSEWWATGRTG